MVSYDINRFITLADSEKNENNVIKLLCTVKHPLYFLPNQYSKDVDKGKKKSLFSTSPRHVQPVTRVRRRVSDETHS